MPSADDIWRWMLTIVGSGVTTISFWVTRAEIMAQEVNGFSLLDSEDDPTARLEEAGRVGRALMQHPDLFARPTKRKSEVGIVVNEPGCPSADHRQVSILTPEDFRTCAPLPELEVGLKHSGESVPRNPYSSGGGHLDRF